MKKKPKEKIHGNRIKSILDELKMSQNAFAKLTELNPSYLSKIILGKRRHISLAIAFKISNALGKPIEEVFLAKKQVKSTFEEEGD